MKPISQLRTQTTSRCTSKSVDICDREIVGNKRHDEIPISRRIPSSTWASSCTGLILRQLLRMHRLEIYLDEKLAGGTEDQV